LRSLTIALDTLVTPLLAAGDDKRFKALRFNF